MAYSDASGRDSAAIPIAELARFICPSGNDRVLAMLGGYFDESGIHAGARATVMAGFVGSADAWARVEIGWQKALDDLEAPYFHYGGMIAQSGPFQLFPTWKWQALAKRCATVLKQSEVEPVAAAFFGDWQKVIGHNPGWALRFPKAYHFVFEMAVVQMQRFAVNRWQGQQVTLMFDRQTEYYARAMQVVRVHQENGMWPHIGPVAHGDKKKVRPLQCADMIANEVYRWLAAGPNFENSSKEPLLSLLMPTIDDHIPGGVHDVKSAIAMMQRSDDLGRVLLGTNPSPEKLREVYRTVWKTDPSDAGLSLAEVDQIIEQQRGLRLQKPWTDYLREEYALNLSFPDSDEQVE